MYLALLVATALVSPAQSPPKAELVSVAKIWDQAPHSAFTDLVYANKRWYCVFREGKGHVSPDGAIRVLTSADGKTWTSAALVTSKTADLRDPKITLTPDGKFHLLAAAALHDKSKHTHQTLAWVSANGTDWGEPVAVGDPDYWLWRVTWRDKHAYGIGYNTTKAKDTRLYSSPDGTKFTTLVSPLFKEGYPNEHAMVFQPDGTCVCLLRRDEPPGTAQLGQAKAPYTDWTWKDLGVRMGGPSLIRLPEGRLIAVVRLYKPKVRTAVCEIDAATGKVTELLTLPSGADTSYPGLVWQDGTLWVSYYSGHEGKTSIYLAKVRFSS